MSEGNTNIKNEILYRIYPIAGLVVALGLIVFGKAIYIWQVEGEEWRAQAKKEYVKYDTLEADRGNIFTDDGSLLATSLPYFELRMDLSPKVIGNKIFDKNVDSLAYCLANFVDNNYTQEEWADRLRYERQNQERYLLIKRNVTYAQLEAIKKFPIFNLGQYRGGLIIERKSKRLRPFRMLAHRTVGYVRPGIKPVGLEGKFDEVLTGRSGFQLKQKVAGNTWIPVNGISALEPESGKDIVTTIDINLQDITENALLQGLKKHQAHHGSAVVMEVETGAIKAIANIGKTEEGYWERYNYAVGSAVEPGSTFKLATMLALLEDGHVALDDTIDLELGKIVFEFPEESIEMVDASVHFLNETTVRKAFEISSNVGMAKMVTAAYGEKDNAKKFIERLKKLQLHLPIGIEIEGEGKPYIKEAFNREDQWSGITLPWMSIGYEVELTPLQILTFYNTIANNGRMMKPYLVSEVQDFGRTIERYKPTVLSRQLVSPKTVEAAQELLEGVVERGTAKSIRTGDYLIAGKTGTAQVDYRRFNRKRENLKYRASFVGYFPADNPKYSCIVMVEKPTENGVYGGEVAAPIFREIADKIYVSRVNDQLAVNKSNILKNNSSVLPGIEVGERGDMRNVLSYLKIPHKFETNNNWAVIDAKEDTIVFKRKNIKESVIPNVVGMGLRDAMYILENQGLQVQVNGIGKVTGQSILAGTESRGQTIELYLN